MSSLPGFVLLTEGKRQTDRGMDRCTDRQGLPSKQESIINIQTHIPQANTHASFGSRACSKELPGPSQYSRCVVKHTAVVSEPAERSETTPEPG